MIGDQMSEEQRKPVPTWVWVIVSLVVIVVLIAAVVFVTSLVAVTNIIGGRTDAF
jgi:hypothetical protein